MLQQLRIVDFAIIQEAELSLSPGLNVLTGETGAGKSIIVGAAGILRGGRASADLVRGGRDEAVVEALFTLDRGGDVAAEVAAAGLPVDNSELLVRRVIQRGGRGRVYVNGALCTVAVLGRVASRLLDISGQHEHQLLSDVTTHRRLLDATGVPGEPLAAMASAHAELRDLAAELGRRSDSRQREERADFLRFQLRELESAAPRPGEDVELEQEQRRLSRANELMELAVQGEQELYGAEGSVSERVARVRSRLRAMSATDPRLEEWAAQLEEARVLVEDAGQGLARYAASVELDPSRLQQVEERLDVLHRLCRKHGAATVAELLQRREAVQRELEELEGHEERVGELERRLAAARRRAEELATELSRLRRACADGLAQKVSRELRALRMPGARLEVVVSDALAREGDEPALRFGERRIGAAGWDRVELCIRTNVGEEALPLRRIASGGELSRIMLALRKTLGEHDPVQTSIYDEVDAGVGGAVADVVGRSLAQVARHRQVLCVTHLPQVAAHADRHLVVGKGRRGRRTVTRVSELAEAERVEELARMLAGDKVTRGARDNARQLLEAARPRG